jgi:hypothetical protein
MTEEDLISELVRCCDTLRRMPFPRHGSPPRSLRSHMPEPDRGEDWLAYPSDRTKLNVQRPSPEDYTHFDRWWPIINGIPNHDGARLIVVGRCWGYSWARLGRRVGCDYRTARARYDMAITAVYRAARRTHPSTSAHPSHDQHRP